MLTKIKALDLQLMEAELIQLANLLPGKLSGEEEDCVYYLIIEDCPNRVLDLEPLKAIIEETKKEMLAAAAAASRKESEERI